MRRRATGSLSFEHPTTTLERAVKHNQILMEPEVYTPGSND
jgi:hypothetical protein